METRVKEFFNIDTLQKLYGIQVKHKGRWISAGDDNGQFLFKTETECNAKRKELKNKAIPI